MDHSETISALAKITDEGLFERLATAVLREAEPTLYANLSHPGMNPAGRTKRSPVDGIGFIIRTSRPHMVVAHHTIAAASDLKRKWLNDPVTVRKRGPKPTAPAGDVIKTSSIAEKERKRTPRLEVTLALTSNQEPTEDIVRDVQAAANLYRITIDIWSASRIAHYLDTTPDGQWLRRTYLGITQERISAKLLGELSQASIEAFPLMAESNTLVERECDKVVATQSPLPLTFIVGESGCGKTIMGYRFLKHHIDSGGYGLVLSHDTLATSPTLDLAIDAELRKFYPHLEPLAGGKARSLCSFDRPLVVIVEDVNWSDRPSLLLERLVSWASFEGKALDRSNWRVLCPVWPRTVATTSNEARKRIDAFSLFVSGFNNNESSKAIRQRARLSQVRISELAAKRVGEALDNDPLLIGLCDFSSERNPLKIIGTFVSNTIEQLCASHIDLTLTDCREALQAVGREMLIRRQIDPSWEEVREWLREEPDRLAALRHLVQHGRVVRLARDYQVERLRFRHDRVRIWLLSESIVELITSDRLSDNVITEPFFADVFGYALANSNASPEVIARIRRHNPLALFYALKTFGEAETAAQSGIIQELYSFLQEDVTHTRANRSLRSAALQVLTEIESSHVIAVCDLFKDKSWNLFRARFLNGDVVAGAKLCSRIMLGSNAPWWYREIAHARNRFGVSLTNQIGALLKRDDLDDGIRVGTLRLAGHLAEPALADAVHKSWLKDKKRGNNLRDYLWAAAQCGGDNPGKLLRPICAAWAKMSNRARKPGMAPPRTDLGADYLCWAFGEVISAAAVRYFVNRARTSDLRFPIMLMLRGANQPEAVAFVARMFAEHRRSRRGFWPLPNDVKREWERRQAELGKPMSEISRERLLKTWQLRQKDKHLRLAAFALWEATIYENDLAVLQENHDKHLADEVLWARVRRGDLTAVPDFIHKLRSQHPSYWWQLGRYFWNEDLTAALDSELERRSQIASRTWDASYESDWIVCESLGRLKPERAEDLIVRHWHHLRFSHWFIEAALLIATPTTCSLASEAVSASPDPRAIFKLVQTHLHPEFKDGLGLSRIEQAEAYIPYLSYLDGFAIYTLWETCNKLGWFAFRRRHLDKRLEQPYRDRTLLDEAQFFKNLDDALQRKGVDWADFFTDRYLEQTDRIEDVLTLLDKWLKTRLTTEAFDFVSAVVRHVGGRSNLTILSGDFMQPTKEVEQIRADTLYALSSHSLS